MRKKNSSSLPVKIVLYFFFAGLLTSCSSSKNLQTNHLYFSEGSDTVSAQRKETVIQPNDLLSIQVYSRTLNQEQAAIFNIPAAANSSSQGYQVNSEGFIDMPVIGSVKASGLTKNQLQSSLVLKLSDNVKNPSVIVRFLQFNINVLGEVRVPGTQKFLVDKVTIIDALSAAGDLTDFGRREDVMVIREEGNKKVYHSIDLRSKTVFESPVYLLQPNDIIYVKPNRFKLKNLNIDPDVQRKTGLFLTFFSFALSITTLVLSLTR